MDKLDLKERLIDYINSLDDTFVCGTGALKADDSLVLNGGDSSSVVETFMDGTKEWKMVFDIACKGLKISKIEPAMNKISLGLNALEELKSSNDSFDFIEITVNSMIYPNGKDERHYFIYAGQFAVNIEIKK